MEWLPNPYQLRTLMAVAKFHSFREVAAQQHVTVSAISQQMLTLSRETKSVLYERRGNKIYLTPAGLNLTNYARQIVQLSEEAVTSMEDSAKFRQMRVSLVTSIAEGMLPQLYQALRGQLTENSFRVDIKPGAEIIDDLNSGSIDVALLPSYGEVTRDIDRFFHENIASDQLVAVVQSHDPLYAFDYVSIHDLSQRSLILESQGSPNCQRFLERFDEKHLSPTVELFCPNNSLAIRMALTAGHVAIIPEVVARTSNEVTKFARIVDGVSRSLQFCCPKYILKEPSIAAFRRGVHETFRRTKGC